jgi:hypothetical protein
MSLNVKDENVEIFSYSFIVSVSLLTSFHEMKNLGFDVKADMVPPLFSFGV